MIFRRRLRNTTEIKQYRQWCFESFLYRGLCAAINPLLSVLRLYCWQLVVWALLFASESVSAYNIPKVHPLYLEKKISTDFTHQTVRDKDGFLWIATDNGLKRYDGYSLELYTNSETRTNGIDVGAVNIVLVDSKERLWGAGVSLSLFNAKSDGFINYGITNDRSIRALVEGKSSHLWLGGEGFGLLEFDPESARVINRFFADGDQSYIRNLYYDKKNDVIWVAFSTGLYLFNTTSKTLTEVPLPLDFSIGSENIRSMDMDADGRMWIASVSGLFVIDTDLKISKHYRKGDAPGDLSTDALWSVKCDSQRQIWVGTDKRGVHKYLPETDSFRHYRASASDPYLFPHGSITHIYEDDRRNLWMSTGPFGVFRLSEHLEKFSSLQHSFDAKDSLAFNNVLDLEEDDDGNIWIGTDGGGLEKFNPVTGQFVHYRHDPKDPGTLASNSIISLAKDKKGNIWAGTWGGGLNRLEISTGKVTRILRDPTRNMTRTLGNNNIFRIEPMPDGRLLLSVWRLGMQVYDPETQIFEPYFPQDKFRNTGIRSLFIVDFLPMPNGDYLLAGFQGLEWFSPKRQTVWSLGAPIWKPVNDLYRDNLGYIWVATNKNLVRYNPAANTIEEYGSETGLPNDYILSIEQDNLGYLWLGTRNGLARFDPRTIDVLSFDQHDGLSGTQFNRFSHLKASDGRMYFGGTDGISFFNPDRLPRNEYAPKVHITGLDLVQETVKPGSQWLKESVITTNKLVLPNTQRDITFRFSALNFISPTKNQYRFRLQGWEDRWLNTDASRRRARYTNLGAGDYVFQVLGANNEGVWAGSVREIHLTILPAWWQTWWARVVYVVLFLLLMYAYSHWRLRFNRRRERELKLIVSEQTSQLKKANRSVIQLNSELEQRVTHRTRELEQEIEDRRQSEKKVLHIAYHDALTGIHNRAWLLQYLDSLIDQNDEGFKRFALLFIGGDRFRRVNDTHGHLLGDKLLVEAAQRLQLLVDAIGHCARLGSDEFAVVVENIQSKDQTITIADDVIRTFDRPFLIDNIRISFSASIGIVICDNNYHETSQVLRNANIAMQRAKDRGRATYQMFDEEILRQTLERMALEADLKMALRRNQFSVVYQPIIVLATGALSGFEVLIRWNHPQMGMVPPDKFIAMAEANGQIFEIGLWVLETACQQLSTWRQVLNLDVLPTVAVNLSAMQLGQADLLQQIDTIFAKTNICENQIKLEITETALMKHTDVVDQLLESMRERGIELAIDDFGTGYSSLSYLDKLPVQVLKIDRAFVNALFETENDNDSAHEIVRATISLAHNLKMRVVAEGIETEEQMEALSLYDCDYGQGYKIARPLSPDDATAFLKNSRVELLPKREHIKKRAY